MGVLGTPLAIQYNNNIIIIYTRGVCDGSRPHSWVVSCIRTKSAIAKNVNTRCINMSYISDGAGLFSALVKYMQVLLKFTPSSASAVMSTGRGGKCKLHSVAVLYIGTTSSSVLPESSTTIR